MSAVGKSISEHVSVTLPFKVNDTSSFIHINSKDTESILESYHNGHGVLATRHEGAQCFIRSSKAEPDWPDMMIGAHPTLGIDDDAQIVNIYVVLGRPQSRGEYSMNTTAYKLGIRDDEQLALIDYKLLTHADDIDAMVDGESILKIHKVKRKNEIIQLNCRNSICIQYYGGHECVQENWCNVRRRAR